MQTEKIYEVFFFLQLFYMAQLLLSSTRSEEISVSYTIHKRATNQQRRCSGYIVLSQMIGSIDMLGYEKQSVPNETLSTSRRLWAKWFDICSQSCWLLELRHLSVVCLDLQETLVNSQSHYVGKKTSMETIYIVVRSSAADRVIGELKINYLERVDLRVNSDTVTS